jgi:hypothetical protein
MKKYSTETFIQQAKTKFGDDSFDYSLVNYHDSHTPIKLICKKHGEFIQKPHLHLSSKKGCRKCGFECRNDKTKSNNKSFIEKARKIHVNNYIYDKVNYITCMSKVIITCPIHGDFRQRPNDHLNKKGCPRCAEQSNGEKSRYSMEIFIEKAKKVWGDKYTYENSKYIKSDIPIAITCKNHGDFYPTPNNFLMGSSCQKCAYKENGEKSRYTTEEFILKAMKKHKNIYSYEKAKYVTSDIKITITCSKHGDFEQNPAGHISGQGCPKCRFSKGELMILDYLEKHNIPYKAQHRIKECFSVYPLPFDFSILDNKKNLLALIEYQGEQHYVPYRFKKSEEAFIKTQNNDRIKKKYCIDNKIPLLLIPYTELSNIYEILDNFCTNIDDRIRYGT